MGDMADMYVESFLRRIGADLKELEKPYTKSSEAEVTRIKPHEVEILMEED